MQSLQFSFKIDKSRFEYLMKCNIKLYTIISIVNLLTCYLFFICSEHLRAINLV